MRYENVGGIGWRIARARKESGLTQEELAALIGVSPRSIQGYEAGKVVPYRRLRRLAEVTSRELGWILEGEPVAQSAVSSEVVERIVTLVEEVSAEAQRIRAVSERLEHLLGAAQPTPLAAPPSARD
jgi:transcriptional regulator with XRE-family HTH domain